MIGSFRAKRLICCAFLAASLFSGCSFTASVDSLLSPPMLSDRQKAVYEALADETGDDITLIYPKYGEYRSAFLFCDLDGDSEEEAVAFYEKSKDSQGMVRVGIIDKDENNKLRCVYDHAGAGSGIERVFFSDFGKEGGLRMAIGYTYLTPTEKTLRIYSYKDGLLTTEYTESYYNVLMTDLNRDGGEDAVVINCNNDNHGAYVSLVTDSGSGLECTSTVKLSENSVDIPSAICGYIGNETPAVFVDGRMESGNLSTEIIYCVDGQLRNPAMLDGSSIISETSRASDLYCMDIDGDGVIEIPANEPFPGYRDVSEKLYVTNWNVYENYEIVKKYSSFADMDKGYCFMLPVRWEGLVTVKRDNISGEAVFCKYASSLDESRVELMRILVTTPAEAPARQNEGYQVISISDTSCVMVRFGDTDDNLLLTYTEVTNNMYII